MLFSVNQASHLYVVKDASKDVAENAGDIVLKTTDDNKNIYFSYMGEGGLLRSDLIPVENVIAYSYKTAESLKTPLKKATVVLNNKISANPVAGQDYILKIAFRQFAGMSDEELLAFREQSINRC